MSTTNVTDIRNRLPVAKFKPLIVDHSRVEAYEQAPDEIIAENQRVIITAACRALASCVGVDRMIAEVAAIAGFEHAGGTQ